MPYINRYSTLFAVCVLVPLSAHAETGTDSDPLESINRQIFSFNKVIDAHLARPIAQLYTRHIPLSVQQINADFFGNLSDVWSTVNFLLQGRSSHALTSSNRVFLNTTEGWLGTHDVATKQGYPQAVADFGQTLGYWGVPSGPYLVLPFLGPSTFRDGAGSIVGAAVDPLHSIDSNAVKGTGILIKSTQVRSSMLNVDELIQDISLDDYVFIRAAYLQRRETMVATSLER